MKTITTEQFNALPEDKKRYWEKVFNTNDTLFGYTPIQINLEDAERVLEEAMELIEKQRVKNGVNITKRTLAEALNNLKQLTKIGYENSNT